VLLNAPDHRSRAAVAIAIAAALAAGLVASGVGHSPASAGVLDARPNVVIVQTDDQDLSTMKAMGLTNLLVGSQGATFRNHFATHPVCCPSRSSLFTGQHSHNHGVLSNNASNHGGYAALDHSETLPVWLDRAGYATGHIGKYMNGTPSDEIPPGWDEWYSTFRNETERLYNYRLNENGTLVEYGSDPQDYMTDVLAGRAEDFIDDHIGDAAPFYLQVDTLAPHREKSSQPLPRNPRPAPRHAEAYLDERFPKPPSFNERDVSDKPEFLRRGSMSRDAIAKIKRRYRDRLASLLAVDELVARLIQALETGGEVGNTLFIFTSDNGYLQGEHRFHRGKRELWEESVGVPLMIRGPGFEPGTRVRQVTANIDLAPTILDAAEAEPAGHKLDGRPLQPLAADPSRARDRVMLLENGVHGSTAIRTRRWVYIKHILGRELYDLRRDPYQMESLHESDRPAVVRTKRSLARQLRALEDCVGRVQC
jgi:N-acetylglucosamine-6-sulfatase